MPAEVKRFRLLSLAAPAASAAVMLLSACSHVRPPEYQAPETPGKTEWSHGAQARPDPRDVIQPEWWTGFGDRELDGLVRTAIAGNVDLRILALRIDEADAQVTGSRAQRLPTLGVGADASVRRSGGSGADGSGTVRSYSGLATLNWELDVWGKLREGHKAEQAAYKATEAEWRAGFLQLVAESAATYFLIRQYDEQLDLQRRALANNEEILGIYQSQHEEGLVAQAEVLRQQGEINTLRQDLAEYERLRRLAENRMATLMGKPAGTVRISKAALRSSVKLPDVPVGLPSDLLSRRPDIVATEYIVQEAYHLTGEAKLARLPSISLTASGGAVSTALSAFLKQWTFGLAPSVNLPIFDPSIGARIKARTAQHRIAEEQYRRAILTAFEEVENALVNLDSHKAQKREIEQKSAALNTVREQVRVKLAEGVISQLEVLESERGMLSAGQDLLDMHHTILLDTVTLYKALGGGWSAGPSGQ